MSDKPFDFLTRRYYKETLTRIQAKIVEKQWIDSDIRRLSPDFIHLSPSFAFLLDTIGTIVSTRSVSYTGEPLVSVLTAPKDFPVGERGDFGRL